jgi:hypothetical protein
MDKNALIVSFYPFSTNNPNQISISDESKVHLPYEQNLQPKSTKIETNWKQRRI